ncbi:hypothetical protein JOD17_003212 [Geomicrobium sediminis]|uniref:Uncharacterized protein n=1 Tax=Geomicrobium sediminis TaxID=1347788 RepID=A0ABS2PFS0_9BACL|nr:hypothetical protein [Geomicrobium sediminis]
METADFNSGDDTRAPSGAAFKGEDEWFVAALAG